MSAPINALLLFTLGLVCTAPLLSSAGSGAAPREVFRGRKLLSVEPGNKVRCRYVMGWGGWGLASRALPCVATWVGGPRPAPPVPTSPQHSLLPSQPFTRQEIIGFVIGSVSSVLYLFSRLPQIRTNVSPEQGWGRVGEESQPSSSGLRVEEELSARGLGPCSLLAWATESNSPGLGLCLWKMGTGLPAMQGSV